VSQVQRPTAEPPRNTSVLTSLDQIRVLHSALNHEDLRTNISHCRPSVATRLRYDEMTHFSGHGVVTTDEFKRIILLVYKFQLNVK